MGDDGWLLEDGPKWCSILVSTTEVRTTLLFYIYGSWVRVRELAHLTGDLKTVGSFSVQWGLLCH